MSFKEKNYLCSPFFFVVFCTAHVQQLGKVIGFVYYVFGQLLY